MSSTQTTLEAFMATLAASDSLATGTMAEFACLFGSERLGSARLLHEEEAAAHRDERDGKHQQRHPLERLAVRPALVHRRERCGSRGRVFSDRAAGSSLKSRRHKQLRWLDSKNCDISMTLAVA